MTARSIFLYELVKSRMSTVAVTSRAPTGIAMPKSICKAMAPPRISASDVEMLARMALTTIGRPTHRGVYFTAASLRHRPVTMPKWATLCCKAMSMMVDSVTTHNRP